MPESFHHEALFYADADELLAATVPFLREGVEAGEAAVVAMPRGNLDLLRSEFGDAGERVRFTDMAELGRNPARIIPAWREFVEANLAAGRNVRAVGEPIWAGRNAAELDECERHEALLNVAFDGGPAWPLLCPYNVATLPETVLEHAEDTHPHVSRAGERHDSRSYLKVHSRFGAFEGMLEPPAAAAAELVFGVADLAALRVLVRERARRAGLGTSRTADLVLSVDEVATNSVEQAGGGVVRVWAEPEAIVCEVVDEGRIEGALIGRQRPRPEQLRGRGLWIANQLCDLVQIRSGAGSVVRLHMSL